MAHKEQDNYVIDIKNKFKNNFKNCKVLGVGTFNVCGTESNYFEDCDYTGIDIGEGDGVDIVCCGSKYNEEDNTFDTIISCECFEHNPVWKETIDNCIRMLKPGGLFLFTCATTGRKEHGTRKSDELNKLLHDNWKTMPNVSNPDWDNDYYKNLTINDIITNIDINKYFIEYEFKINNSHYDMYFYGIKK